MKKNYKTIISTLIKEINKDFPNIPFGTHLALALTDYPNVDSITDKEFAFILEKYKAERELDHLIPHTEMLSLDYFENDEEDEFDEDDY